MASSFDIDNMGSLDGGTRALRTEADDEMSLGAGVFRRTATRADILDAVTTASQVPRSQARDVLEATLDEVSEALVRGEPVKLRSFGLFSVRAKRERIGRNPRTGVEVPIKPRRVLTFRPSSCLLDQVNARLGAAD